MDRAIRGVIFDLDNCLSAADEPGSALYEPAFEAIRRANAGRLSAAELEAAFSDCWRHAFDAVALKHRFSEPMRAAGWDAFRALEVRAPMRGYGDLEAIFELPVLRFLVTSGFRRLQESKIAALGVASRFHAVHVDAIDEPGRLGKEGLFRRLLHDYGLRPQEVLVIGDSAESELSAGNALGMTTVQILRPGVPRAANAQHYIQGLAELEALLCRQPGGRVRRR